VIRGIYRLTNLPPISDPDLVTVSLRYPKAVICLVSALAFHDITTQIPHRVSIAVPRHTRLPSIDYPPLQIYQYSDKSFKNGIEEYQIDNVDIKIYSMEKTLADSFKFRNKIGMDIVLEALKLYKTKKKSNVSALLNYAKINRVEKVMRPYLEASL